MLQHQLWRVQLCWTKLLPQFFVNGHVCAGRSSSSKDNDDNEKANRPPPVFLYSMSVETHPLTVTRQERLSLAKSRPF